MSIIFHFGKEWKDLFEAFLLDPPDGQEVPGRTEPAPARALLDHRGSHLVGDPGQFGDLPGRRLIDIYPFSKEVFLPEGEGARACAEPGLRG